MMHTSKLLVPIVSTVLSITAMFWADASFPANDFSRAMALSAACAIFFIPLIITYWLSERERQ